MALLVLPGDEKNTSVVDVLNNDCAALLGCSRIERWPYRYQLDTVVGPDGHLYRFEIWVDEEGAVKQLPVNLCATLAAHPLNEYRGRVIRGPALLVSLDGASFTLDDWGGVCQSVWYDDGLVEVNANGKTAECRI
jgi:hypothetical protein